MSQYSSGSDASVNFIVQGQLTCYYCCFADHVFLALKFASHTAPSFRLIRKCHRTGKASSSRVGDGGASWRLKALARAKQQATDESNPNYGRRVGDIVSEQWGSLAELTAGLTDTRAAHGKHSNPTCSDLPTLVHPIIITPP